MGGGILRRILRSGWSDSSDIDVKTYIKPIFWILIRTFNDFYVVSQSGGTSTGCKSNPEHIV